MNFEEKKKNTPPLVELTDDELEEISGGKSGGVCYCPRCKQRTYGTTGSRCPYCNVQGIDSRVVEA